MDSITAPAFFHAAAALRAATTRDDRADAIGILLALAFGPDDDAQAEAARVELRQRSGWHVTMDGAGGWCARPCMSLRPRPAPAPVARGPRPAGATRTLAALNLPG